MLAGHLAGVPVIGYANKPGRVYVLAEVQARDSGFANLDPAATRTDLGA